MVLVKKKPKNQMIFTLQTSAKIKSFSNSNKLSTLASLQSIFLHYKDVRLLEFKCHISRDKNESHIKPSAKVSGGREKIDSVKKMKMKCFDLATAN